MKKSVRTSWQWLFVFCLFSTPLSIFAQKIDLEGFKNIKPRSIGPASMSGRVTAIDVDIKNDIIYAGSASGGLWKSASGGVTWIPIFDKESNQSIGAITVNQANPAEIWVGTGEGNPRNSQNFGNGIYKSIDGGKTWKNMGLANSRAIHRIVVNPQNSNIVIAGVQGSSFGPNEERGVFKTTDGGKTWRKVLYVNDQTGVADLIADPSNPNKLIVAMWEFGRKPWTFNSGGKGSGIYTTYDGGETWTKVTDKDGLPKGELGRCGLALCRTKPNVVYALVEAKENAIYRSDDGGTKWRKVGTNGDRPFYYAEMYVDPLNENRIYNIFSRVHRSEDGGKTWSELLDYNHVHPDHHAWWIHPTNPSYMIDGNDGGLAITRDMGASWQFGGNIPVGQFYHVNVDNEIPYNLYGGLQDNGSWVGPSAVWRSGGIRNADWQELYFGDGFDVMPKKGDSRYVYAMSQGGNVAFIDRKTGYQNFIQPQHPDPSVTLRYNWNAAMAQDPFNDCGVYFASQFLHYSTDCGQNWTILSPDLTTNDTAKINASQRTGGLTPDVTNAENHCTILAIAPSPLDKNVIWIGTDDGNVQLTQDGGKTWKNMASMLPNCPKNAWIPQIEVSQKNAGEAFVIVNNYRQNDFKAYAYHTTDFGKTWERIVNESQIPTYTLCITQDAEATNLWFLGTDDGLYFTIDGGKNWTKWTNSYPSVPTMDMKVHPRDGDLVLGTFGRAFWILDDIRFLREIAKTKAEVLNKNLRLFAPADAYLAYTRSYDGERFSADAIFEGQNKSPIAVFTVWSKPKAEDKSKDDKPKDDKVTPSEAPRQGGGGRRGGGGNAAGGSGDKAKVTIFTEGGDTVRTFTASLDSGMNRIFWPLNRNGGRFPAWEDRAGDADDVPGTGGQVLPGRYKVVIALKGEKDSTFVNVKADPRVNVTVKDLEEKDAARKDLSDMTQRITDAFNRLKEANKTVGLVDGSMVNAPDSTKKDIEKLGKAMKDSILTIQKMFMSPNDAKGIVRVAGVLMDAIQKASFLIATSPGKPSSNAQAAITAAKVKTKEVLTKVNQFFEKDWPKYQQKVEAARSSLFKKYEPIKID
ncbi:MAG: hypothetical protein JNL70_21920 [Saprospiraceae bacterium]|nr:hypothetical protein [Saprospiraceae bacterium]